MGINSTPRNYALGTEDLSSKALPSEDIRQPQHCGLFMMYTEKGEGQRFVTGTDFKRYFGAGSLDPSFKGFNKSSKFAALALGNANASVVRRIIPADAKAQKANVTFFVEVSEITYSEQVRNSDGSLVFNVDGTPKAASPVNTIAGFAYRVVTKETLNSTPNFSVTTGTWQPTGSSGQSKLYPILSLEGSSYGEAYNKIGWVLNNAGMNKDQVMAQGEMLFALKRLDNIAGNPKIVKTSLGTNDVKFSFTPDAQDYISKRYLDIPNTVKDAWSSESNYVTVNDLGIVKTYPTSYTALRNLIVTKEEPLISTTVETFNDSLIGIRADWYDYDYSTLVGGLTTVSKIFDFITMKTSSGVVLQSIGNAQISGELSASLLSGFKIASIGSTSPSYMLGGLNGTMDQTNLEAGVVAAMSEYLDTNARVQSTALNPESNLWDPGYTVPTKLALANFISVRRDTIVDFTTEVDGVTQTDADRLAIAITLDNRMALSPESDYFGTTVARYTINFGAGNLTDNSMKGSFGLNYDLLDKVAQYMGAGNGLWKSGKAYDTWPGSRVTVLKNITPEEVAPGMRDVIWQANCIFADPKNMKEHFFTGAQTGYKDELSVLNSHYVIQAISYLVKLNDDAWREVSGSQKMSKLALKARVEGFINGKIKDAFDDNFIVYPEVTFSEDDLIRNYAWHLNVHIAAHGMMTRQTSQITTERIESLTGAK